MACGARVSPTFTVPIVTKHMAIISNLHKLRFYKVSTQHYHTASFTQPTTWTLHFPKVYPWEVSTAYPSIEGESTITEGANIVKPIDKEDASALPLLQSEAEIIEIRDKKFSQQQPLKWSLWFLGPSVLLATGMAPTLWLPLSSVFIGPNIAGLLSLVGLDCIFNIGATLFLLMADTCARSKGTSSPTRSQVPFLYKLWNVGASLLGFFVPLVILFSSQRGYLQPHLSFISFAVLLGPYLLLLSIQVLTEMLSWHWKSSVWLVTPIVYEAYRILQLMRGLNLGIEVGAPEWALVSIRLLVSWWVWVLSIQLIRVAWFAGVNYENRLKQTQSY